MKDFEDKKCSTTKEEIFDFYSDSDMGNFVFKSEDFYQSQIDNSLKLYFKEISQYPLLSAEEEIKISKIISNIKECKLIKSEKDYSIDLKKTFLILASFEYSDEYNIFFQKLLSCLKDRKQDKTVLTKYIKMMESSHCFLDEQQISFLFHEDVLPEKVIKMDKNEFLHHLKLYFDYCDARNKMIVSNLRFVVSLAKRYSFYNVDMLELINEGNLGLIRAIDMFDPNKDNKFSTYAYFWIKNYILKYLNHNKSIISLHNAFLREAKEFYFKVNKLKEETKKNYTARELSEILDIDYNKVVDFLSMHREIVSLDQQILDTSDETLGDYVEDKSFHIEDGIFQEELKEKIACLLETLTDKEREYVFMRFGFNEDNVPFDLAYICKKLKISRSRALLLEKKIIMKLGNAAKNNSKVKSLKIYLS